MKIFTLICIIILSQRIYPQDTAYTRASIGYSLDHYGDMTLTAIFSISDTSLIPLPGDLKFNLEPAREFAFKIKTSGGDLYIENTLKYLNTLNNSLCTKFLERLYNWLEADLQIRALNFIVSSKKLFCTFYLMLPNNKFYKDVILNRQINSDYNSVCNLADIESLATGEWTSWYYSILNDLSLLEKNILADELKKVYQFIFCEHE